MNRLIDKMGWKSLALLAAVSLIAAIWLITFHLYNAEANVIGAITFVVASFAMTLCSVQEYRKKKRSTQMTFLGT